MNTTPAPTAHAVRPRHRPADEERPAPPHPRRPRRLRRLRRASEAEDGFSMTELMVVLVIVGILALLALPRFLNVTTKAKTSEAKMMLRQVHTLQQSHYFEYDAYATDLLALGFDQRPLVTNGGPARYQIAIEAAQGGQFVATATAVVDFDKDGTMNVWQVDQEGVIAERTPD